MDVQIGKYKMGDFGLKLLGVDLGTPSVRKSTVTIPGRNGALDLTEAITGFPVWFFRNYPLLLLYPMYLNFASSNCLPHLPYIVRFIIFNLLLVPSTNPLL